MFSKSHEMLFHTFLHWGPSRTSARIFLRDCSVPRYSIESICLSVTFYRSNKTTIQPSFRWSPGQAPHSMTVPCLFTKSRTNALSLIDKSPPRFWHRVRASLHLRVGVSIMWLHEYSIHEKTHLVSKQNQREK